MKTIIYPPRPKSAIPPSDLDYYESTGLYCAQPKYNGSRSVIYVYGNTVKIYSRHGRPHLNYAMPQAIREEILAIPGLKRGKEYWLDGELLTKTTAIDTKGKIVLFDILQEGEYFFLNPNQEDRVKLLAEVCGNPTDLDRWRKMSYVISDNILMAPTFFSNFDEEFKKNYGDEVEGLVLRKRNSVIDNFGEKEYLVNWLIRCRHPHKNYQF